MANRLVTEAVAVHLRAMRGPVRLRTDSDRRQSPDFDGSVAPGRDGMVVCVRSFVYCGWIVWQRVRSNAARYGGVDHRRVNRGMNSKRQPQDAAPVRAGSAGIRIEMVVLDG